MTDIFPKISYSLSGQKPSRIVLGSSTNGKTNDNAYKLYRKSRERSVERQQAAPRPSNANEVYNNHLRAQDLSKQITRRWRAGDIYAPHDLSEVEMAKWKKRGPPKFDVFDVLNFNPMEHYRVRDFAMIYTSSPNIYSQETDANFMQNFAIMSEYMTEMGRIKHSKETGLRPVNQRKIARAIRRTIGMGLMPSVHHHPEILYKKASRYQASNQVFKNSDFPTSPI